MALDETLKRIDDQILNLSRTVESAEDAVRAVGDDAQDMVSLGHATLDRLFASWQEVGDKSSEINKMCAAWAEQSLHPAAAFEHIAAPLVQEIENTEDRFEDLASGLEEAAEAYLELDQVFKDLRVELQEKLDEVVENLRGQLQDLMERIDEDAKDALDRVTDTAKESLEQAKHDVQQAMIETTQNWVQKAFEDLQAEMMDLSQLVDQTREALFSAFSEKMKDKLVDCVEREVRLLVEDALSWLLAEVQENITMTLVGTQVTAGLTPILPQLAAARAVAGTIRSLMEKMMLV